jgi:titin
VDKFSLEAENGYGTGPEAQVEVLLEVAPPAPAVTAVPGPGQVSLSWVENVTGDLRSGVGGISGHEIYEGGSLSPLLASQFTVQGSEQTQGGETVATVTATVTGLANLRTYYFKVANLDAAGLSPPSAQVSATTPGLPGAPLGLAAHRGDREVFLTWQPPASLGGSPLTSYDIYMGTSPGAEGTSAVASTTATAALVRPDPATITNGTKYYFSVKAFNAVGPGPESNEVSATPEAVPGPPGDLVATAGPGSVKLSWGAPSSAGESAITGYDLYQGASPGAESATPVQLPAVPTSRTVSGLTAGTAFYFYLVAENTEGSGLSSNEVYATPTMVPYAPGVPLDLTAHRGNREVFLTWQPPASYGGSAVTSYDVYMGTSPGAESPSAVASTSGTAALVRPDPATIINGTKYYFTVKAVNAIGTGPASSEVSATPEAVPGPPADLVATATSGSVKLTWSAPGSQGGSPITGYDLYQGGSPGSESTTPVTLPASPTSYTVTGLTSTVGYYFTLAAVNASGVGLLSGEVSATPMGAPGAPGDLKATAGDEQVGLSWSTPSHNGGSAITGYTVLWRQGTSVTPTAVPLGAAQATYTVPGLTNATAYQFAVEATNSSGTGPATAWADASPTFNSPPLAPGDLAASVSLVGFNNGDITLKWSKPTTAGCPGYGNECTLSGYELSYDFAHVTTSSTGLTSTAIEHIAERLPADALSDVVVLPLNFELETFSLVAINGFGAGAATHVKVLLEVVPQAPVVSAAPGTGQVSLSWIENDDLNFRKGIGPITGFEIYSGTAPGSETGPLGGSEVTSTSTTTGRLTTVTATVTLPNVTKYYFKVALTDSAGSGPASGEVSATPNGGS